MATPPRISPPGSIHKITHRTTQGEFLLRPDPEVTNAIYFLLGYMQEKYEIEVHAGTALSNHPHLLITDVLGDQLGNFNRDFFSLLGRFVNALRGHTENLFHPAGPSCQMVAPFKEDLVDHSAYVILNGVEAGLVPDAKRWPGVCILPRDLDRFDKEIRRPPFFFDPNGPVPEVVRLRITTPKALDCSAEELRLAISRECNLRTQRKQEEFAEAGKKFMGRKRILRQSVNSRPGHTLPLFTLNPHVACKNKNLRIRMLRWRRDRNRRYRALLEMVRQGVRDVVFPIGTLFQHFQMGFEREPWSGCLWTQLAEP